MDQGSTYQYNGTTASGSQAGATITAPTENIGLTAGSNFFNQTGGSNTTTTLNVSNVTSVSGTYSLSGGTLSATTVNLGSPNGTDSSGNPVTSTGTGSFLLSGGSMTTSSLNVLSNGSFVQSGGTNSPSSVSIKGNSASCYELDAGTLSIQSTLIVGFQSGMSGLFNQTGGTASANILYVGYVSGDGTVELSGGTLSVDGENLGVRGGMGQFLQTGGSNSMTAGVSVSGGSTYTISGGTLYAAGNTSQGGISPAAIDILSGGLFEYNGGSVTGNVTNAGTFNVRGGGTLTLTGNFTNDAGATLKTYGTTFDVTGTFTNNGTYSSDPATNRFGTLSLGSTGQLLGGVGDKFIITGDLLSTSTDKTGWNTEQASLTFDGDATHTFDVNGFDEGASWAGYSNNFAWGMLSLGIDQSLELENASDAAEGALYVGQLDLAGGLAQLDDLRTDDVNVYYDAALNPWLSDQNYTLPGGGELIALKGGGMTSLALQAAVPEPGSLAVVMLASAALRRRRAHN